MFTKLSKTAVSGAVLAVAVVTATPVPASATSDPLRCARAAVHFDLATGQTPENIALAPDGTAYVTLAKARQVAALSPGGSVRILATLPGTADGGVHTPALGFPLTTGIVRADEGTLYFLYATGTADLTGVWRLRPGGRPQRIAALPAAGLPNGLALNARTRSLYVTDSALGTIWRVPTGGGTATAWSTDPALAPAGFLGANGLKIHNRAVWATNLDKGTILRIPILADGSAGTARVTATGLTGIDDFAFTGHGDDQILAALDTVNQVALVRPDGTHITVLTAADGLQGPTSIALRGNTVHVLSAAYLTAKDPNLILARLND
ncbi:MULTISPECIES: SMP-30/gluconolactonase/LRE family protein [unclassified Streptomyces]|uniref:SMP-30/gluconolactonase/LRE family protein n=1 Tax=unclassified Streptomyces TaxID=2593676 RepID=UPI002E1A4C82